MNPLRLPGKWNQTAEEIFRRASWEGILENSPISEESRPQSGQDMTHV